MWIEEVVFSKGDLGSESYVEFINVVYQGSLEERCDHVFQLLDRLFSEYSYLYDILK